MLLPGGRRETIEHTFAQTAKEIFGVFSCYSGTATLTLQALCDKASNRVARAQEERLSRQDIWFLLNCQLGPGLRYGLECNMASWK